MWHKEIVRIEQSQQRMLREFENLTGNTGQMVRDRLLQLDCEKAKAAQRLADLEVAQEIGEAVRTRSDKLEGPLLKRR